MAKAVAADASSLGIDLASGKETEMFKWFLACLLFGKPIQREVARRAFDELVAAGLTNPQAILNAGWDKLVALLDKSHYVRFDFSTATKLLDVAEELKRRYGTVSKLVAESETPTELSRRLQEFKHIGPVTARIFLREIRPLLTLRSSGVAKARRAA